MVKKWGILLVSVSALLLMDFCSIKKMAMKQVANALTAPGSGNVFTGDNDPELVGDALPFTIKMYESMMVSIPWHEGLKLRTGSLYIMYANAFLQNPANMLPDEEFEKQEFLLMRSKNLYLRGRDIILEALEKKYPGFLKNMEEKEYDRALAPMKKEDAPFLYWGAAGWLAAYAIEPLDMKLGLTIRGAGAMMDKVLQLDKNFEKGAIHDFYVSYYGSMPEHMGGDANKARDHYKKAIEASGGKSTSSHLSLATTVSVNEQNLKEFKELLNKVLEVDPDADPDNRLVHILNQRKAKWLLEHVGNFFVEVNEEDEN
ncbi:MAG: TRAP transporter TatT component family protein [Candidatus Aminicenantes bacterium]|nr:MAG: TRAP transporter TatT component family protein [Candidatus Aminicenantes bacterium]